MADEKNNGVAKPEDFRRAYEQRSEAVRLVLPKSGFPVLVRRLSPLRVLMQSEKLGAINFETATNEERAEFARVMLRTIEEVLIHPRLSLTPGPAEIDPNWLPEEDAAFLFRWGLGAVTEAGDDLAPLFRRQDAAAETRATGPDVAVETERPPGGSGRGGAAD